MKNHTRTQAVLLHIPQRAFRAYLEADEEISRRVGNSPGPHALMALRLDASDDAQEIADLYCHRLLRRSRAGG